MIDPIELCIAIQQIAAPTFAEGKRAAFVEQQFRNLGLLDVWQDDVCNVYGRIPGSGAGAVAGAAVVVSAHTDTVFPAETDLTIERDEPRQRVAGPGIGDNSMGVAAMLAVAEAIAPETLPVDVWFVANTGEEGVGDLRGMRAAFDALEARLAEKGGIGASVVIEGMGLGRIVHEALGSRRYRISVEAPGGHSWGDFGSASAVHVLVQLADKITRMDIPAAPRTSFNIGKFSGGTSVNTIAEHASLELDLRSVDTNALAQTIREVETIVHRYQSNSWKNKGVRVNLEVIGDRPVGEIAPEHPLVRMAVEALEEVGVSLESEDRRSSTDANIPLSRGIPSVCVGVTRGGDAHRLDEWISTREVAQGIRHLEVLVRNAAGWVASNQ